MISIVSKLWMMSIQTGILVMIVMIARFFLRKYPKVYSYILWAVVGIRLLCPVWVEVPAFANVYMNSNLIQNNVLYERSEQETVQTFPDEVEEKTNIATKNTINEIKENTGIKEVLPEILMGIYFAGVFVLTAVYLVKYVRMKKRLSTAVLAKKNVWFCENINSPFVMGVFRPQIYLPYGMDKVSGGYILKHERTHIKHHDPLIRMVGILCLCLHWWNPLVWLAVHQMNQDMEMYCDEGFLLQAPLSEKKAYANVLLTFAAKQSGLWFEVAFGESHTEKRIKNIISHKKKGTASLLIVLLVTLLCGCSFLETTPDDKTEDVLDVSLWLTQYENQAKELEDKLYGDDSLTQLDMNLLAADIYTVWDNALNDIWNRLKQTLSDEEMSILTKEEKEWIAYKDYEANRLASEYDGSSSKDLMVYQKKAELTKQRVYELTDYVGKNNISLEEN